MYPVSSVKERNRKGGKCKISRVLQSPVSSTQASPKVEASNRPKQAQHLSTSRNVQNGNTRVHQGLSDSRGMGVVDRPIKCLPSHPHPPKLKEVPKVLPQVTGVPVHLPSLRVSHGPSGRLAYQGPVFRKKHKWYSGSGRPDPVLRDNNTSGEVRTKTYSSVFVCGL